MQHITTAITLTLLFRSLGALIFGVLADRFGRKWTLVCNLILVAIFELGSGFCNTYHQFLAVRSLFGIAMGGKLHPDSNDMVRSLTRYTRHLGSSRCDRDGKRPGGRPWYLFWYPATRLLDRISPRCSHQSGCRAQITIHLAIAVLYRRGIFAGCCDHPSLFARIASISIGA